MASKYVAARQAWSSFAYAVCHVELTCVVFCVPLTYKPLASVVGYLHHWVSWISKQASGVHMN